MKQFAVELHSHTHHSDADFSVEELCQRAVDFGYEGLILTDHNTSSGYSELAELAKEAGIVTLGGIEWTTYYGHMLVHDADRLVDWRTATPHSIDKHMREVKEANGLIGIAHPFAIGSPMCTGCHWTFDVKDWNKVNYIEIWNSTRPDEHFWSWEAYALWTRLLDDGYRISCSAGRDWHRMEGEGENPPITYVESSGEWNSETFRQSLEKGTFYISLGPGIRWYVEQGEKIFYMGDTIKPGLANITVEVLSTRIESLKKFGSIVKRVKIIHNNQIYFDEPIDNDLIPIPIDLVEGNLRIEFWGTIKQKEEELLLISNPIYIEE